MIKKLNIGKSGLISEMTFLIFLLCVFLPSLLKIYDFYSCILMYLLNMFKVYSVLQETAAQIWWCHKNCRSGNISLEVFSFLLQYITTKIERVIKTGILIQAR